MVGLELLLAASFALRSYALDNGLVGVTTAVRVVSQQPQARTPPMGWNTYNHFGCSPTEDLILDAAKAMVSSGLRDLGYNCSCPAPRSS